MRGILRLLGISALTAVIIAMVVATVHFWGLGRTEKHFTSPFFEGTKPWIVSGFLAGASSKEIILWADVEMLENKSLVIRTGADSTHPLMESLSRHPDNRWILNIRSNVTGVHQVLAENLASESWNGRILIQSDHGPILSSLKELKPFFIFGSSTADRMRFRIFESLWILSATPFKGDVYIGPLKTSSGIPLVDKKIVDELHRRSKHVILGPAADDQELEAIQALGADGIILPLNDT